MKLIKSLSLVSLSLVFVGCSSVGAKSSPTPSTHHQESYSYNVDPFESYNRWMFKINTRLMNSLFEPVVKLYDQSFPVFVRSSIHNVFSNVQLFPTIGNDLLQGNFTWACRDTARLFLNTTLGGLGLIDVASSVGLYSRSQSFGLTLGKWGVRETPYVVLPILGPSTVRGTVGMVPDFLMSPINFLPKNRYYYVIKGVEYIQIGSEVFPKIRFILDNAIDPYVAMRNAYLQHQYYLLKQVKSGISDENDPDNQTGGDSVAISQMAESQKMSHKETASSNEEAQDNDSQAPLVIA